MGKEIPKRVGNVMEKRLPDEFIIVNTNTNELMVPSSVGEDIWKLIDGSRTVDEIIDLICLDYGVKRDEPAGDDEIPDSIGEVISAKGESVAEQVQAFVDVFVQKGIVEIITL